MFGSEVRGLGRLRLIPGMKGAQQIVIRIVAARGPEHLCRILGVRDLADNHFNHPVSLRIDLGRPYRGERNHQAAVAHQTPTWSTHMGVTSMCPPHSSRGKVARILSQFLGCTPRLLSAVSLASRTRFIRSQSLYVHDARTAQKLLPGRGLIKQAAYRGASSRGPRARAARRRYDPATPTLFPGTKEGCAAAARGTRPGRAYDLQLGAAEDWLRAQCGRRVASTGAAGLGGPGLRRWLSCGP